MPGKIVHPREESFGKVFDSGLRQSLFLPGLSALSTKLITVQRALSCLVCLFLPTVHPASPSLAQILSFLLPIFLSLSPFPPALSVDLCVVGFFSLALSFFTLASLVLSTNLLPNGVLYGGHGRSPSACLPEKSPLRFDRRCRFSVAWLGAFSIIARVLPSPGERSQESPPALPCPASASRAEPRRAEPTRTKTLVRAACRNADFTLSRARAAGLRLFMRARVPDARSRRIYERDRLSVV